MRIALISDTHQQHSKIAVPECDLLIHSGDACNSGSMSEFASFANWMEEQTQAKHKIYVPGNHDWLVERSFNMAKGLLGSTHLLVGAAIEIEGCKIYGLPWSSAFCNWAFQADDIGLNEYRYRHMDDYLKEIPLDTDILVTHGPPFGILDQNEYGESCGSKTVRNWLDRKTLKPTLYVCGHIHQGVGYCKVGNVHILNAAKDPRQPYPITLVDLEKQTDRNSPDVSLWSFQIVNDGAWK